MIRRPPGNRTRCLPFPAMGLLCLVWTVLATAPCPAAHAEIPPEPGRSPESAPSRIISLSPVITKTLFMLGAGHRVKGNTIYCTEPAQAKSVEKVGSVRQADVEKIIRLTPDLVIACSLTSARQVGVMTALGLNVITIDNPDDFETMCRITRQVGDLIGEREKAARISNQAADRVAALRARVKGLAPPSVFIQIGLKPLHTVNRHSFIHEYIAFSRGRNIAGNEPSGVFSRERVLKENPAVILIATMGSSEKAGLGEKKRWLTFDSLRAARTGQIHVLDPQLICSPTPPDFARGLGLILPLIHPEADHDQ